MKTRKNKKGAESIKKSQRDLIKSYWSQQAVKHGKSHVASWSDLRVIEMEIRELDKHLSDGDRVLDAGCANGYMSIQLARKKEIEITGIDYSRKMIDQARSMLNGLKGDFVQRINFKTDDITRLKEADRVYDKVIVVRVLINLHNWGSQLKGLRECVRVLKPGGRLLLSEATLQGWQRLNKFRNEWGLPKIPMPWFNRYLDQEKVVKAVSPLLQLVDIINFASTYYIGTRVLKPLLAIGRDIDTANPNMEWNRWFSQLPSWGDYGTQKLFVFKKQLGE
ncbi:MAG: class I SAM-dependent methyltransferase [Candidatus Omnitrophota bacterium]